MDISTEGVGVVGKSSPPESYQRNTRPTCDGRATPGRINDWMGSVNVTVAPSTMGAPSSSEIMAWMVLSKHYGLTSPQQMGQVGAFRLGAAMEPNSRMGHSR